MTYEVWDGVGGNRLGGFPRLELALELVREMAELEGPDVVTDLQIEAVSDHEAKVVLEGPALVARALGATA